MECLTRSCGGPRRFPEDSGRGNLSAVHLGRVTLPAPEPPASPRRSRGVVVLSAMAGSLNAVARSWKNRLARIRTVSRSRGARR